MTEYEQYFIFDDIDIDICNEIFETKSMKQKIKQKILKKQIRRKMLRKQEFKLKQMKIQKILQRNIVILENYF